MTTTYFSESPCKNTTKTAAPEGIAVDYGPAAWTNRICDHSPGAARSPGLVTDDHCTVIIRADSDDKTNQPSAFLDDV
ncbi:MAG: hypothetical protein NTY46_04665 [Candidatus Sumerlaeota bacterium]|nr:hypothetical protein [Candidatus Sumerlaeota bacterium]